MTQESRQTDRQTDAQLVYWQFQDQQCTRERAILEVCCICVGQTLRVHSPDGSTFLRELTSWPPSWKYDVISEIRLRQSIRRRTVLPNFHPDLIWNDGAFGLFWRASSPQEEQYQQHNEYITLNLEWKMQRHFKKVIGEGIAVNGSIPWHSYGVSLVIRDHTELPAIRHKWTHPALTPTMQAGTRFTYPAGMEGWVDLVDLIAPRPGVEPATFRSRVQRRTAAPPRQPTVSLQTIILYHLQSKWKGRHVAICSQYSVMN